MRRFMVIATTIVGAVTPHEELDEADQLKANAQADLDDAEDGARPKLRESRLVQRERDAPIRKGEDWPARKPMTTAELFKERVRRAG